MSGDTYAIYGIGAEALLEQMQRLKPPAPKPTVGLVFTASGHVTKKGATK